MTTAYETVHVMQEKWDYLIILDACRYDYFKKIYRQYFSTGQLLCKYSVGSSTREWRNKSFPDFYEEVVYVSANPYINSVNPTANYYAKEHFFEIIDVWASGWDAERGTVCPDVVTRFSIAAIKQHPDKRFIIHYLQPHAPYLGFGSDCKGFPCPDVFHDNVLRGTAGRVKNYRFRRILLKALAKILEKTNFMRKNANWYHAQLLGLPPASPMDAIRRKHGQAGLQRAYEENLKIVLEDVSEFIKYLKGKIIITSDHGELLGENGEYSHYVGSKKNELLCVPWLIIEKEKCITKENVTDGNEIDKCIKDIDESAIKDRLRDLGYL